MPDQVFRVANTAGMWLRTAPVVSEATRIVLLPKGQLVTKLGNTEKPDWWRVRTTVRGDTLEGFSNRTLLVADAASELGPAPGLLATTLAALAQVAPKADDAYLQAIRQGQPLFDEHGITTPQRMAHFLAQAMQETGAFTVLRESMSYSVPRMLEIFGVGNHSARITEAEAPGLARNERALAERVYGLGNPRKAEELGNTQAGDGFLYRGNGVLQTTGRGNHRRMGEACGLDFEGHPELVTMPEHALKPALHEWTESGLNRFADQDDIRTITLRINGGLNGFPERKAFLARLRPLLS
jgi:putative chitinase